MESNKVKLRMPKFEGLEYGRKILSDKETMSYNIAHGNNVGTGCIEFDENAWKDWFYRWVNNMPEINKTKLFTQNRGYNLNRNFLIF